jgi:predicted type IV restriction endonuclease
MALVDDLRRHGEQVRKRQPNIRGEEATKMALVLPFLVVLGFDIYDPTEVQPEYVADFAKKRSAGPSEKVDYAIHLGGNPVMYVECKAADVDLQAHSGQLSRYFNATPSVKVGVLTNGIRYLFFTDLDEPNIMGDKPFFEFNALSFTERDAESLEAFTKSQFEPAKVRNLAEDIIYTGKLTGYVNDLLRNPSESFVRFLLGEINIVSGRTTARVVEKFVPIIKKAIQMTLLDMATRSIKLQTEEPAPPAAQPLPPAAPPPPAPIAETTTEQNKGIVTTPEEIEGYDAIRRICLDATLSAKYPVQYRDSQSYFGMHIIKPKYWFMRLFFDSRRKALVTRVSVERAAMLAPGFEVDTPPENFGRSRVYVAGPRDFDRLRPLILLAYEDVIKRCETGTAEDDAVADGGAAPST